MVRELGRLRRIEWQETALGEVHRLTGGHPLLARWLASDACRQGELKQVGDTEVQQAAAQVRRAFHRHRIGRYYEESIWAFLRPDERRALLAVAVEGGLRRERIERELEDAVANLEHFGIISESSGKLEVTAALLRDWLEMFHGEP